MKHTKEELKELQSLPLATKVELTKQRIKEWVDHYGEDGVYVSFSGGKDSTVLLDIARKMYPNVKAVFVDTGLEYPEIRDFVKTFDNIDWLKPKMNFRQVIERYGYPFFSKEVSDKVHGARNYLRSLGDGNVKYADFMADVLGIDRRENPSNEEYLKLKQGTIPKETFRYKCVTGTAYNKTGGVQDTTAKDTSLCLMHRSKSTMLVAT